MAQGEAVARRGDKEAAAEPAQGPDALKEPQHPVAHPQGVHHDHRQAHRHHRGHHQVDGGHQQDDLGQKGLFPADVAAAVAQVGADDRQDPRSLLPWGEGDADKELHHRRGKETGGAEDVYKRQPPDR